MHATVVSFVPWTTPETKPGMIPGFYELPARVDKNTPGILVVTDAKNNIYMGFDREPFPSPVPADQLAKSLVDDAVTGYLEVDEDSRPGYFWLEGKFTAKEILEKFPKEVEEAKRKQNKWFMKMIKVADDTWARFHQHRMITDIQRAAAFDLGLNGKEWAMKPEPISLIKCPACRTMIESDALVCSNCRAILKPEEAKKAGINFAA
jgi:hypothetical protein